MPPPALLANPQAKPGPGRWPRAEADTTSRLSLQLGPETFGIFDTLRRRKRPLGPRRPIAGALLARPPSIEKVASKSPY